MRKHVNGQWIIRRAGPGPRALISEAIDAFPELDSQEYVSAADLLDWFCEWRERAKQCSRS